MVKAKTRVTKVAKAAPKKTTATDAPPTKRIKLSVAKLQVPQLSSISGTVLACGQNDVGQLGFDPANVEEKTRPAILDKIKDVVDIKAGGMHSLCLTKDGDIYSFGCNDEGALGRDTTEEGSETIPGKIQLPKKAVRISCGDSHSACVLEDGSIYAWGSFRDAHGSMGLTTEGKKQLPIQVLPEVVAVDVASGSDHFVVLTNTGNVYTIGCGEQGQLGRASMRTLSGESRRGNTTLLTPGIIYKRAKGFVADAIWATPYCTFLREASSKKVFGFGLNNYNQICVSKGKNEFEHYPVATKIENVKEIAGGQHHTIVLTNDDKVYSIGRKEYGRLGLGDNVQNDLTELTSIAELENKGIVSIACGAENSFAITKEGKVYVWGSGTSSTLGTGEEDDVNTPRILTSAQVKEKNSLAVSGGGQHTLFLIEAPSSSAAKKESTAKVTAPEPAKTKATESPKAKIPESPKTKVPEPPKVNGSADKVVQESSSKDINGNSEKDDASEGGSMNAEEKPAKRGRKRKA